MSIALVALLGALSAGRASALPVVWGPEQARVGATAAGQAAVIEEAGVRLFGIDDPAEALDYFRRHRIAVAGIAGASRSAEGEWSVTLVYPSLNSGGEGGGSNVLYSHVVVVVAPPDAGVDLAGMDRGEVVLVLEPRVDADSTYDLVGTAAPLPRTAVELDWFADKPELLFRGESR